MHGCRVNVVVGMGMMWLCLASSSVFGEPSSKGDKTVDPPNLETRGIMHSMFKPLSELLPVSLDFREFTDPKNKASIKKQIDALVANVDHLEKHSVSRAPGFRFLSHSLARDVHEIQQWYDLGRYDESRFIIHNLTEYCISCHSQQTGSRNFPEGKEFFAKVEIKKLPLVEKAQLQVATRQFDDALNTYETFFESNDFTPAQMALMQAFTDYLKVAVRVRGDLKRPIPVLEKWAKRDGVPAYMQIHIKEWIDSLKKVDRANLLNHPSLANAKKLMKLGQTDVSSARSREKLVYFIAASALLGQLVTQPNLKSEDFAEAYYMMGICESVIGRSFWISQTEFYLESAIRGAPHSKVAQQAFRELEEQIFAEFSGSSGTDIPKDMQDLLKELRAMAIVDKPSTKKL